MQHALSALGVPPADEANIVRHIGEPFEDFPQLLGIRLTSRQTARFVQEFSSFYSVHMLDNTMLYDGVVDALARVRSAGIKTALVTNKEQEHAERILSHFRLSDYFDYIRGWRQGRRNKPDPEPLIQAMHFLAGTQSPRVPATVLIGDSEQDVLAARAAGIDCIACLDGLRETGFLLSFRPSRTAKSFSEAIAYVLASGDR